MRSTMSAFAGSRRGGVLSADDGRLDGGDRLRSRPRISTPPLEARGARGRPHRISARSSPSRGSAATRAALSRRSRSSITPGWPRPRSCVSRARPRPGGRSRAAAWCIGTASIRPGDNIVHGGHGLRPPRRRLRGRRFPDGLPQGECTVLEARAAARRSPRQAGSMPKISDDIGARSLALSYLLRLHQYCCTYLCCIAFYRL